MEAINELCELYDLSSDEAMKLLRESIGEALNYNVTSDAEIDGKIVFYAPKKEGQKIIRYSPLLEKRVRKILSEKIDKLRALHLKTDHVDILAGTITDIGHNGLKVTTKVGKAIVPSQMLIKEEKQFYQIGATLNFHIRKITPKGIILDRRSKILLLHTLKHLLPKNFVLYDINRKFGKRIKVYSKILPSKEDLERIRMAFVEHIDFVMYDRANIEDIKKEIGL